MCTANDRVGNCEEEAAASSLYVSHICHLFEFAEILKMLVQASRFDCIALLCCKRSSGRQRVRTALTDLTKSAFLCNRSLLFDRTCLKESVPVEVRKAALLCKLKLAAIMKRFAYCGLLHAQMLIEHARQVASITQQACPGSSYLRRQPFATPGGACRPY